MTSQFPNEACTTGPGPGYAAKVFGPALPGIMFGSRVSADMIPQVFLFFAIPLILGGITYQFAQTTRGTSLDSI